MTGADVREARRLLGWSQWRLAIRVKVPQAVIGRYEATDYCPSAQHGNKDRLGAIRAALEQAGVEFTDGDAPGVKLRRTEP